MPMPDTVSHAMLSGVRVLELGHYIAGPHAAQMMADQGAEVIKVEPTAGDPSRRTLPHSEQGTSLFFACHNRHKRSIALDLGHAQAHEALDPLLKWADVVITNYSAGIPDRLGFGFERLHSLNEKAVMVHITGFDQRGPWRNYLAFDGIIMAMSGLADLTGDEAGPPLMSQALFADHSVAAHAAFAAASGVIASRASGKGQLLEINMLDVMTSYLTHNIPSVGVLGLAPTRARVRGSGVRFVHMFSTCDGYIYVAAITIGMWRNIAKFLGHPEWAPADLTQPPDMRDHPELLKTMIDTAGPLFAAMTAREAMDGLQGLGVTAGIVRSVTDLYGDEGARELTSIATVELPLGEMTIPVPGPAFGREGHRPSRIPDLGEQGAAVLRQVGLEDASIDRLTDLGVLHGAAHDRF